ncbi:tetratricopeptide repeat protein [Cytobacillus sp. FJAT-54145]|uniref:Tetratricopeptide repeat protein n=1 Tax=Cytobacillus spartinae TaxID=3299023 RepID=A0ABW6K8R4_9BACI
MDLKPKYSLNSLKKKTQSAIREFTDREEPTKAFFDAFQLKDSSQYKVLTYYGVGGIGKSRLLRELFQKVERVNPSTIKAILDFKEEKHRYPGEGLLWLREELKKKNKIKFTTFDLAYTIYWSKLNPQLSLKSNNKELPFIEEGSFVGELIHHLEDVPLAQWVPKTLRLINGFSKYKDMLDWWSSRGKEVMSILQESLPSEIEDMLPVFWAADLKDYIEKHDHPPVVIFIDTYEAIWEKNRQQGSFYEKDSWVQEFVLQLPEVLWVICGREKIQWAKTNPAWGDYSVLEQHLMGELSQTDSEKFLKSCGIEDEEIAGTITQASQGLPYYLDLMVDTYNLIQEKRAAQPDDFSKAPQEILNRFLRYLELSEKETLRVLSFTRYWDTKLFQSLIVEFKTGYPSTAYTELFRFSFINEIETNKWDMHSIMRTSLQEEIKSSNPYLYTQIHHYLFNYYNQELLNVKLNLFLDKDQEAFREAFFHGRIALSRENFFKWFLEKGRMLQAAGQFQLIASCYNDLMSLSSEFEHSELHAYIHQYFGEIHLLQGKYDDSIKAYKKAVEIFSVKATENQELLKDLGKSSMDLAEVMIHTTEYQAAFQYLSDALIQYQTYKGVKDVEFYSNQALIYIRLGKLNIRFSNYDESMTNYESALASCDEALKLHQDHSTVLAMKALAYEKLGELYGSSHYEKQGECYQKSIYFYEKALENKQQNHYLRILTNQGLAYKRLAEHYKTTKNPADKLKSFRQAISIYNKVLSQSPEFVDALEKKGHALVDYMALQAELELYDDALGSFYEAVETFEKVLEIAPTQGGSRNRLASAYRELAKMYMNQEQNAKATEALRRSLKLSEDVLAFSPQYIYVHNSMGKTYELLGDYYAKLNDRSEADKNYTLALEQYDKMLEKAPKLREPIRRIENIKEKQSVMKGNAK